MAGGLVLAGCSAGPDGAGVYLFALDGSAPRWIGTPAGDPVWSPDGTAVAWGSEEGLRVAAPIGEPVRELTRSAVAGRPDWSPSGDALAYVDRDRAELIVLEMPGGAVRFATPIENDTARFESTSLLVLGGPAWAPDGTRLAFTCWDGAGDELCVIDANGNGRRQVTRIEPQLDSSAEMLDQFVPAPANVGPPSWSPDGIYLGVAAYPEQRGAPSGVFIVNVAQGQARRISPLQPNSEIVWHSDGQSVFFSAVEKGRSDAVRVVIADGSAEKPTSELPAGARDPVVSADGSKLAVAFRGAIKVIEAGGVVAELADNDFAVGFPAWDPIGGDLAFAKVEDPIAVYE